MTGRVRDTAIRIKLQEMTESTDIVKEHLPGSADSFVRLGIVKDGIYKRAEYAIENVFDICAILNADLHLGVPGTDEDILENLVQHGVLAPAMRQNLKAMKGFRNIVVHRYGAIDDALAFSILEEHIDDFSLFRREIELFLQSAA
ncbi:type VII toxin-antitoxin system HepT family RNase toxin [Methanoculleus sp.]|uniref:type VII toxin-antitoxin system HepT family RNase toxin n=1 Tax=Methanoculleus sp. TaxID=90427 RepID=UPI002FCC0B30